MPSSRQHRSATTGQWVPCNASVRPCPREHRQEPSAEREAFYTDIAGQQVLIGLQAQAQRVLDDYSELSFRSNNFHGAVGARLRLWELEDGSVGQGNCARATSALLAALPHDTFGEGQSQIELEGSGLYHAAISAHIDGQWYVIDYTIRQFDQNLPFPYVGTQEAWIAEVERASDVPMNFSTDDEDEGDEDDGGWFPVSATSSVRIGQTPAYSS